MSVNASEHELNQLIYRHLKEHGFHSAADELQRHSPQGETKTSASLLDIYVSWLKDSKDKRKTGSAIQSRTPAKATRIQPAPTSNQTEDDSSSDIEELSQSLLPQTPPASSKKSASAAGVKPVVAASPNKKKLANPFAPVHAAPGESSDTTDISENEGNPPAVSVPAKRKESEGKSAVKVKKTPTKAKVAAAGGDDSDSDSSLDVEKWKKLVLQMTDSDVAKMDTINALDSSTPPPLKKRVRKPRAKPPAKTDTPAQQSKGRW
ncbi:hypothetical protein D5F01_LYC15673 [Larimichthys crocea]|uniref:Uncharacterized protein n=1 Tax=Larimichthys crocea TaxID=215358 RepID=A0A6G0I3V6_LARCR|nr:hypothetical protein D5F01_LYC15673 [Larimichthys crocea]